MGKEQLSDLFNIFEFSQLASNEQISKNKTIIMYIYVLWCRVDASIVNQFKKKMLRSVMNSQNLNIAIVGSQRPHKWENH